EGPRHHRAVAVRPHGDRRQMHVDPRHPDERVGQDAVGVVLGLELLAQFHAHHAQLAYVVALELTRLDARHPRVESAEVGDNLPDVVGGTVDREFMLSFAHGGQLVTRPRAYAWAAPLKYHTAFCHASTPQRRPVARASTSP